MSGAALFLMRYSPAQVYCANTLFRRGVIDCVYLEEGATGEPDPPAFIQRLWRYGPRGIWQRLVRDARHFGYRLAPLAEYYLVRFRTWDLMAAQAQQDARWLGPTAHGLVPGLRVVRGSSVNDPACHRLIREHGYRLVFVFGTGILKDGLLRMAGVTFVNLHEGWLPTFRGEGIISALAEERVQGVGVSLHVIDRGIDTGPILCRERLIVEPGDNAYTIALKATIRGTDLFEQVFGDAQRSPLTGHPQEPGAGRYYGSRELKMRYRMRVAARRTLRTVASDLSFTRALLKRTLAGSSVACGMTLVMRRRHGRRLRILMYHGVVPRLSGPAAFGNLFIEEAALARHLHHVTRAFRVVSLEEVLACLRDGRPFPERAVLVTFDDGYRNVLTTALPLLRRFRVPAVVLLPAEDIASGGCSWVDALRVVVADCVRHRSVIRLHEELVIDGRLVRHPEATFLSVSRRMTTTHPEHTERAVHALLATARERGLLTPYPEFALAGWDEWRSAVDEGLLTVGSHGPTHQNLAQLTPARCLEALRRSKAHIERELSRTCEAVAYPYGEWNRQVVEAARMAGYACGFTTDPGLNDQRNDPFALRRTTVPDKGHFALFCNHVSGLWRSAGHAPRG